MTEEPPGPHDEWLTGELTRLRATGRGEPPMIVLIAGLQKHAGLGPREAKAVVDDYGRRNGLAEAWAAGGNSPLATVFWLAALVLLVLVNVSSLVGTLRSKGTSDSASLALEGVGHDLPDAPGPRDPQVPRGDEGGRDNAAAGTGGGGGPPPGPAGAGRQRGVGPSPLPCSHRLPLVRR